MWYMMTAALPVVGVLVIVGVMVMFCDLKNKLFSRHKHRGYTALRYIHTQPAIRQCSV